MKTIDSMKKDFERLLEDRIELEEEIDNFELNESDYEDSYIELLDMEGTVTAGGYEFYPSRILSELDPIAYACGLSDYVGTMDKTNSKEYSDLCDKLESLNDDIETLENEINEFEGEGGD